VTNFTDYYRYNVVLEDDKKVDIRIAKTKESFLVHTRERTGEGIICKND
jgi:hypothetical protein